MKVKNAYNPPIGLTVFSIVIGLVLGSAIFFLASGLDQVLGFKINVIWKVLFSAVSILIFVWSIFNDYRGSNEKISKYKIQMFNVFECPDCQNRIRQPLDHEKSNGIPILYECGSCEVLWYTGYYVHRD